MKMNLTSSRGARSRCLFKLLLNATAAAAIWAMPGIAHAQNLLTNASFEILNGAQIPGISGLVSWTGGGDLPFVVVRNGSDFPFGPLGLTTLAPTDGINVVVLTGRLSNVAQQPITLTGSTNYTLTFDVSKVVSWVGAADEGYTLGASPTTDLRVNVLNLAGGTAFTTDLDLTALGSGWTTITQTFIAPANSNYSLEFVDGGSGATDFGSAVIDNVSLTASASVPEPATYAMLAGLAVLGLAGLKRRRRG